MEPVFHWCRSRASSHFVAVICSRYVLITRVCCLRWTRHRTAISYALIRRQWTGWKERADWKIVLIWDSGLLFLSLSLSRIYSFGARIRIEESIPSRFINVSLLPLRLLSCNLISDNSDFCERSFFGNFTTGYDRILKFIYV